MHRGFRRGMDTAANTLTMPEFLVLRKDLRVLIGGASASKMHYWINGKTIIRKDAARKIERVFAKRGISASDVWD